MGAVQLTTVLGSIINKQDHLAGSVMTVEDKTLVCEDFALLCFGCWLADEEKTVT